MPKPAMKSVANRALDALNRAYRGRRVEIRPDDELHHPERHVRILRVRHDHLGPWRLGERIALHVRYHPDDGHPRPPPLIVWPTNPDASPESGCPRPDTVGHGLVDDDDRQALRAVASGEVAAGEDGRPERMKHA